MGCGASNMDSVSSSQPALALPREASLEELLGDKLLRQGQEVETAKALDGKKAVALYFSAHWCPPCRGFTPQLAQWYSENLNAKGLEIVFVSSDQDSKSFKNYSSEMPWLAVPFADRARKEALSKRFKVQGIPSVVVLDVDGKVITTDGRTAIASDPTGEDLPWKPKPMPEIMAGAKFLGPGGKELTASEAIDGKTVAYYFSAHWCPPCRGFTPTLAEAYSNTLKSKGLEIVFVSSDRDESSFKEYFATMPWLALDYNDSKRKGILNTKFSVSGIPSLVIVGPDGAIINKDGRAEIAEDLEGVHFPWYPKPVPDLKSGPGALNEIPTVVAFCEGSTVEVQQSVLEAMKLVALQYIEKMPEGEETVSVAFMIATEEGGIAAQLRKIMSLPAKPEGPRVMLIDIPDDGAYYCGPEGEVTAEGVATFVANYENKALIRSRLSKL